MDGAAEQTAAETNASRLEMASDVKFSGRDAPYRPEVLYFKDESNMEKLIRMRLSDGANKAEAKTYHFRCSSLSGMKEAEAVKMDAVLLRKYRLAKRLNRKSAGTENRETV